MKIIASIIICFCMAGCATLEDTPKMKHTWIEEEGRWEHKILPNAIRLPRTWNQETKRWVVDERAVIRAIQSK